MSALALGLTLAAALLHALWNAIVKGAADRSAVVAAIAASHAVVGGVLVAAAPAPAPASWPFVLASASTHYVYYFSLSLAYRTSDLSQVYPIARGLAPVLVAAGAQAFAGETLPAVVWIALVAISVAIGCLSFSGRGAPASRVGIAAAVGTGLLIAGYTVIDGMGVRRADSPFGYMGWLFLLELPVAVAVAMRHRGPWAGRAVAGLRVGVPAGLLAVCAYGLVIYAKTIAPLGMVSAVRESSVIMAALIGVVWFHERPWAPRLLAAVTVAAGVIVLASAA